MGSDYNRHNPDNGATSTISCDERDLTTCKAACIADSTCSLVVHKDSENWCCLRTGGDRDFTGCDPPSTASGFSSYYYLRHV